MLNLKLFAKAWSWGWNARFSTNI